jgi:transposase
MGFPRGVRRDFEALERRRLQAADLLQKGLSQSEVARRVGAHRQSVSQWPEALRQRGRKGLRKAARAGRRPKLGPRNLRSIERGARARSRGAGLQHQLVDLGAGGAPHRAGMRDSLRQWTRVAYSAAIGMELSAAGGAGTGTR